MTEIEPNNIDPSAASPGAILKRCREYHDITLEEAEEATKIGANYLQALEEDQIGQFASVAYLKGFLRIYTTYLGLNPDDMIRMYDKQFTSGYKQGDQKTGTAGNATPATRKKFPLQKLFIPAVLLTLIIITAAIINRPSSSRLRQIQPEPIAAPAIQPVRSSAILPPPAIKTDEATVEQQRPVSPPPAPNKIQPPPLENIKGFIAHMKVIQAGTLTVNIDDSTSQDYELVVGDNIEWKANHSITLELSNAGGVELDINGKQIKPTGQPGKPAVIVLDADGIKQ